MNTENIAREFFINNKDKLLSIYETEEEKQGKGLLFMKIEGEQDKINVFFLNYENIEDDIKKLCNKINKKYICVLCNNEKLLITLDGL